VTVDGQAPAEVAAALGMTAGAVHTAKSRVLGQLSDGVDVVHKIMRDHAA
jgi:DNA-directed RNA polymerase specialized sigma24 family protein